MEGFRTWGKGARAGRCGPRGVDRARGYWRRRGNDAGRAHGGKRRLRGRQKQNCSAGVGTLLQRSYRRKTRAKRRARATVRCVWRDSGHGGKAQGLGAAVRAALTARGGTGGGVEMMQGVRAAGRDGCAGGRNRTEARAAGTLLRRSYRRKRGRSGGRGRVVQAGSRRRHTQNGRRAYTAIEASERNGWRCADGEGAKAYYSAWVCC